MASEVSQVLSVFSANLVSEVLGARLPSVRVHLTDSAVVMTTDVMTAMMIVDFNAMKVSLQPT